MGPRFVRECNHVQESHTRQFFFLPYLQHRGLQFFFCHTVPTPRFVDIQKFCYHGNVAMTSSVYSILVFGSYLALKPPIV